MLSFGDKNTMRFQVLLLAFILSARLQAAQTAGPLRVHPTNPRYFTDGTTNHDGALRAVYLTGSHHWRNFQDDDQSAFDYSGYLDFMGAHRHNFMRLWAWEKVSNTPPVHVRAGMGKALDGGPKFDLDRLNPTYFERLRSRVVAARERGIYVSIMLFQGWDIERHGGDHQNPWPGHAFHRDNNVNGIDGDPDRDNEGKEIHTLKIAAITRLQEAYVRKLIDTLNDLENILYEITNEDYASPENTAWQYHMIRFVQSCEKTKRWQHPVGMTVQGEGIDATLWNSPADWVSPGGQDFREDPPLATGTKVILNDTDHLWGVGGDDQWVWRCFLRGLNPIYMDPLPGAVQKPWMSNTEGERTRARLAMRDTAIYATKVDLAAMTPRKDVSTTGYCLAKIPKEYLVYQAHSGQSFSVELNAGTYRYEWFDVVRGAISGSGQINSSGGAQSFKAPFPQAAVLYLKAVDER